MRLHFAACIGVINQPGGGGVVRLFPRSPGDVMSIAFRKFGLVYKTTEEQGLQLITHPSGTLTKQNELTCAREKKAVLPFHGCFSKVLRHITCFFLLGLGRKGPDECLG